MKHTSPARPFLSSKTSSIQGVASKVAALDRQHPCDLFDVWQLYESGDLSDGMAECIVIYLAGHNRPPHEVLFGSDKDIAAEYERAFVDMTEVDCSLEVLLEARTRLRQRLPALRWKLANFEAFHRRRPADFSAQADALVAGLDQAGFSH